MQLERSRDTLFALHLELGAPALFDTLLAHHKRASKAHLVPLLAQLAEDHPEYDARLRDALSRRPLHASRIKEHDGRLRARLGRALMANGVVPIEALPNTTELTLHPAWRARLWYHIARRTPLRDHAVTLLHHTTMRMHQLHVGSLIALAGGLDDHIAETFAEADDEDNTIGLWGRLLLTSDASGGTQRVTLSRTLKYHTTIAALVLGLPEHPHHDVLWARFAELAQAPCHATWRTLDEAVQALPPDTADVVMERALDLVDWSTPLRRLIPNRTAITSVRLWAAISKRLEDASRDDLVAATHDRAAWFVEVFDAVRDAA